MVIAGVAAGLLIIALLTLVFGRWYCSVLCPLGVLQDAIGRVKQWWFIVRGKRKALRVKYRKPMGVIRYGVLLAVAACYALGVGTPLMLTDPYSNFGRICTTLFRPVAVGVNNLFAKAMNAAGNYSLYVVRNIDTGTAATIFAAVVLVALIVTVWRRGRLWCNTVCPVGTLLGIFSRASLFRIRINPATCNSCGLCEAACKSECIDSRSRTIDASRCVTCFNCIGECRRGAVEFAGPAVAQRSEKVVAAAAFDAKCDAPQTPVNTSRRDFLRGAATAAALIPALPLLAAERRMAAKAGDPGLPMPPGAGSVRRFTDKCTACLLCVGACPTQVLKPAGLENGLAGFMQPRMSFSIEKFCNFECMECVNVCPTDAIRSISVEEKKLTRVGTATLVRELCVVMTDDQDCGACAEHCPTQAVHMVPWEGTLTIPQVDAEYCIGCGGCESICPVLPVRAITVRGVDVQDMALPPKKDDFQAGEVTDFGF
jgi:ferredoxin